MHPCKCIHIHLQGPQKSPGSALCHLPCRPLPRTATWELGVNAHFCTQSTVTPRQWRTHIASASQDKPEEQAGRDFSVRTFPLLCLFTSMVWGFFPLLFPDESASAWMCPSRCVLWTSLSGHGSGWAPCRGNKGGGYFLRERPNCLPGKWGPGEG